MSSACSDNGIIMLLSQDDNSERQGEKVENHFSITTSSTQFLPRVVEGLSTGCRLGENRHGHDIGETSAEFLLRQSKIKTCPELCPRIQNRKWAGIVALVVTLAMCGARAEAQPAKKIPRIGYLSLSASPTSPLRRDAFRQGLGKLGYAEGKDFVIEYLYAEEILIA